MSKHVGVLIAYWSRPGLVFYKEKVGEKPRFAIFPQILVLAAKKKKFATLLPPNLQLKIIHLKTLIHSR